MSVPVLSEHILFAPPMVSQASILRTKLLSYSILCTDTANDNVTESGNPYGIATTTTVIANTKKPTNSLTSVELFQLSYIIF